jgi:hypothetical protein
MICFCFVLSILGPFWGPKMSILGIVLRSQNRSILGSKKGSILVIFIKIQYVFHWFCIPKLGSILGPFWGPSFPNRGHYIAYVSDSASLLVPPHFLTFALLLTSKNGSILVAWFRVPKLSILGSIRSPFLVHFLGPLSENGGYQKWGRVGHVCNVLTPVGKWGSQKMDPKMDPKMVPFRGPF